VSNTVTAGRARTATLGWTGYTYADTVFCVVFAILILDLPSYLYNVHGFLEPKYLIGGISAALLPVLMMQGRAGPRSWRDPFFVWALAFVLLNGVHWFDALLVEEHKRAALIATRLQYVLFAMVLTRLFSSDQLKSRDMMLVSFAILVPATVLMDFLVPGVFYSVDFDGTVRGRAAGTYLNPNRAGEAILLLMLLGVNAAPPALRILIVTIAGCGVLVTFSRGAMTCFVACGAFLVLTRRLPAMAYALLLAGVLAFPLMQALFLSYLESSDDQSGALNNVLARLSFFQDQQVSDFSAMERAAVFNAGLNAFFNNVIFGAGAGYTSFWGYAESVHNQAILLAAEYGVFGVAFLLWLIAIVARGHHFSDKSLQVFAAIVVLYLGMFSHNVLESCYWFLVLSMMSRQVIRRS
jgi:O-Antigen ligase